MKLQNRKEYRVRRHRRLRKKIGGTPDCPRMALMKSNRQLYVQFIDDINSVTLLSVGTLGAEGHKNVESAGFLGTRAAEKALEKGVRRVVVDRGGFIFHGRIKAVVDAATEAGLSINSARKKAAVTANEKEEK